MTEKKEWYGTFWAETFLAMLSGKLVQLVLLPDFGLIILMPIMWLIIHFTIGKWIDRVGHKKIA